MWTEPWTETGPETKPATEARSWPYPKSRVETRTGPEAETGVPAKPGPPPGETGAVAGEPAPATSASPLSPGRQRHKRRAQSRNQQPAVHSTIILLPASPALRKTPGLVLISAAVLMPAELAVGWR